MPTIARASHAIPLPEPQGGGVAEWYHLVPMGRFQGRDGRGPYVLDQPEDVLEAFAAWGADLCVDYDHQSLTAAQKQGAVPASGWIKELQVREDGIWGRIDWTEAAAARLQAKEYRYLSPVFHYDPATGAVLRLVGAGLTSNPNLHLQAAASRQGDAMDELLERLRYLLNLPLTSTADEISAELDKLKAMIQSQQADAAAAAQMRGHLGLAEGTGLAAMAQALEARLGQAPDPAQFVPRAQYDTVAQSLARLQQDQAAGQVDQVVKEAMSQGKVPPALESWARAYASRDMEGFKAFVASAPVLASAAQAAGSGAPGVATSTLTPEETTVAQSLGLTHEAYLAAKEPR